MGGMLYVSGVGSVSAGLGCLSLGCLFVCLFIKAVSPFQSGASHPGLAQPYG